ncbi:hypothetical protein AVEN_31982-1 [Araneus ventricosus]|uniref:Tesmin/TSO1-like CXC domain-containing protein n=1 Tax=Araneus ventricosus TaxID=182803 RepID=A0A4Y2JDC9_ARAVE|nr:hypothetical protein AVEN_31982-1 [Araneus ventricosus]
MLRNHFITNFFRTPAELAHHVNTRLIRTVHDIILQTLYFILDTFKLKSEHLKSAPFFVRLKVHPTGSHAVILCDPSVEEFQEAFLKIFDEINQVLTNIPTMQCWIEEDSSKSKLKVSVTEFWMDTLKSDLKECIMEYYEEITNLCDTYFQRFEYILSEKTFCEVQDFLRKEQKFVDVCEKLQFYLERKAEVSNLSNQKEMPLICIDLSFLKTQLIALHDNLINQLRAAACGMLRSLKEGNNRASNRSIGKCSCCFVWGDPATQNLDELRYHSFVKAAAKAKFNLARLPPTTDAAQLHAMRNYHHVQTWLGNEKDPLKWGWMHTPSSLFPKKSEKDPAPESLLQFISCTCKKVCTNACGCRNTGLHCSLLCKHCIGQSCENPMPVILDNESEEGDAPAPIDMVDEQLECEDIELLCSEFKALKNTLLTDPESAKEMVVLIDLYDRLLANEFQDLLDRVKDALSKTIALMNLTTLGAEELKLNSELLLWPKRMKPVFKQCAKLIEDARVRFEEKLASVIRKVRVDLLNLSEHAGDLEVLGDISIIQEYRKEALQLRKRVKAAETAIAWINEVLYSCHLG